MSFIKNIREYICGIKGKWLLNASISMLIIVVITILPSIFELIGTALVSNVNDFWNNCYANGQFLIYGLSLMATTFVTIKIRNQNISALLIIIITIYCIAYAVVNILTDGKYFPDTKIIVTIYVDMELEDQAMVFATINKEQKNVSNSLVADLYEFAQSRSPQKTAHKVARALDAKEGSPFYGKIKILGTANDKDKETITQDTFVKSLMKYITSDPQADRDFYRRNKNKESARPHLVTGTDQRKLFLRNMFITDNTDIKIAQLILNYFAAVSKKWPEAWNNVTPNLILNRSTGFIALMRFLKDVYLHIGKIDEVPTKEEFSAIFTPVSLTDEDFNKHRYVPGSTGQKALYQDLLDQANLHKNSLLSRLN